MVVGELIMDAWDKQSDQESYLQAQAEREAAQAEAEAPPGKPAPKRRRKTASDTVKEKASPQPPPRRRGAFVGPLTELYGAVGMGVSMVDQPCGTAILESAEGCAKSLDELAYGNESVRRVLTLMTQGSAFGAVIVAHVPIALAVASHHGPGNKSSHDEPKLNIDESV
jgi:hypothetical protein